VSIRFLLSHAMGNANVRQALASLYERDLLAEFWTTIRWEPESALSSVLPGKVSAELNRRSYPQVPRRLVHTRPWREAGRLLAVRAGVGQWTRPNEAFLSVANVCYALDKAVAGRIDRGGIDAVYAYEDGALETFKAARNRGIKTVYELPIAHWKYMHELLEEEAELCPGWAETIPSGQDSSEKTDRKDAELELADLIFVPSHYVIETLPESLRNSARVHVCPYGAPPVVTRAGKERNSKLRVLYVGGLTQRKGVAYFLRALRKVGSLVEVTLIGSRVGACAELDEALARYRYIATLPHSQVLAEMERHDVLVFPSLTEGYGLVILEALSRGLPVITTRNTGGPEVIRDGCEGFFVPIRSADAIAEKIELLAGDRDLLEAMSAAALKRAQECTWEKYRELLACTVEEVVKPGKDSNYA
jgi:alpha-maltose-1-phosphate synthase